MITQNCYSSVLRIMHKNNRQTLEIRNKKSTYTKLTRMSEVYERFFPFFNIVSARASGVKSLLVMVPTHWLCLLTTGRNLKPIQRKSW